jgi:plastocyanin
MTKRTTAFAACLALAAALAACGSSNSKSTSASTPAPPASTPATTGGGAKAPTGAADASVVQVDIKDIKFAPATVTVKVGQTVKWTNSDPVAHTVTAKSGSDVDSGTIAPNQTFETKFKKAGRVDYVCTIHPNQSGTVIVTK